MRHDNGEYYPSYSTLWELVDLSGLPWIDQSEINLQSSEPLLCPIVNGNSLAWARAERKCPVYCIQIERWLTTADDFAPRGFDRMFIADRYQAQALAHLPYVRYMPIGGHPGLGGPPAEKKWDFATICYTYGRRAALLGEIACKGYSIAPNGFGEDRRRILASCRAGLSVHQHDNDPSINPLRSVLFAAWKLPLIEEYTRDPYPYSTYSLSDIPAALSDSRGYAELNYRTVMEELPFREVVEAACE